MVSVSLAIEEDGVFVGSISHDILLSDVMERTLRHSPSGTASSLFTREGYVIAHPGYEIKPANELALPLIMQPDSEVRDLWLLARAAEARDAIFGQRELDEMRRELDRRFGARA
jgi:hypothetical protein